MSKLLHSTLLLGKIHLYGHFFFNEKTGCSWRIWEFYRNSLSFSENLLEFFQSLSLFSLSFFSGGQKKAWLTGKINKCSIKEISWMKLMTFPNGNMTRYSNIPWLVWVYLPLCNWESFPCPSLQLRITLLQYVLDSVWNKKHVFWCLYGWCW